MDDEDPQHRAFSKRAGRWLSKVEIRASEARVRLEADWAALPHNVRASYRNQPVSIVLQLHPSGQADCVLPSHLNVPHVQAIVQRTLSCISHELHSQHLAEGTILLPQTSLVQLPGWSATTLSRRNSGTTACRASPTSIPRTAYPAPASPCTQYGKGPHAGLSAGTCSIQHKLCQPQVCIGRPVVQPSA